MRMTHVGTDEAGYGPTLGPLVITATVWQSPGDLQPSHWYEALAPSVTSTCQARIRRVDANAMRDGEECDAVIIADSKKVYQSGRGLADLERTALALVALVKGVPKNWRELIEYIASDSLSDLADIPWFADFNPSLPLETTSGFVEGAVTCLKQSLRKADLSCVSIHSRLLTAMRFNRELERLSSKGELLSKLTLQLVSDVLAKHQKVVLWADKHGGRAYYASLLSQAFGAGLVQIEHESREESAYRVCCSDKWLRAVFLTRAERLLPVAASSIISKYLRELAMVAFNRFWQAHLPNLTPTAGYPVDAKRFLAEIAPVQEKLGIAQDIIRRKR